MISCGCYVFMQKISLNGTVITALLSQVQKSESRPCNNGLLRRSLAGCLWLAFVSQVRTKVPFNLKVYTWYYPYWLHPKASFHSNSGVLLWKKTCVWLLTFEVILTITWTTDINGCMIDCTLSKLRNMM